MSGVVPLRVASDDPFLADVLAGLSQKPKAIPARWFYDHRGSELFEDITRLPEYYPTRVEIALLRDTASAIAAETGQGRVVVEFGSGSSTKTPLLLDAVKPAAYVPIDISGAFLRESAKLLSARFPDLMIRSVEADFTRPLSLPAEVRGRSMLGFFPGSTIGNAAPSAAVDLLRIMAVTLGEEGMLLIGIDTRKPAEVLIPAYDDAQGVTAAFNLNLLHRINRELDGTLPIAEFRHVARWNEREGRVEMHVEAARDLSFTVAGRRFGMLAGETIHTENSHKYTPAEARLLLRAGGWDVVRDWVEQEGRFALYLARRHKASIQD